MNFEDFIGLTGTYNTKTGRIKFDESNTVPLHQTGPKIHSLNTDDGLTTAFFSEKKYEEYKDKVWATDNTHVAIDSEVVES